MSRTTQKARAWARIQRIVAHRDNPAAPVDAATLLRTEANRLRQMNHLAPAQQMAWAFDLAAAKLDAWQDPAMQTRFQKIPNATGDATSPRPDGPTPKLNSYAD